MSDMICDVATIVETISKHLTLERGDLIATGTPAGVGLGFEPPRFLRRGDVVSVTADGFGALVNQVG
jgi:2-keto-4-pentenoate hydratase/2-oxohepta-3-ene-1,7-dioic acid hydratase in catechol pathway